MEDARSSCLLYHDTDLESKIKQEGWVTAVSHLSSLSHWVSLAIYIPSITQPLIKYVGLLGGHIDPLSYYRRQILKEAKYLSSSSLRKYFSFPLHVRKF